MKFKGTKGKLEKKYASGFCIGIGTIGCFSQITANSILPPTDIEYYKERIEIEANMQLYSKAPEMLDEINETVTDLKILRNQISDALKTNHLFDGMPELIDKWIDRKIKLIKEATEL